MKVLGLRVILAWVWLTAAAGKWGQTLDMAEVIAGYRLLPAEMVAPLAVILPPLELVLGLSLLAGFLVESALLLSGVTFGLFALAIAQGMWRGIDISCGCFSLESTSTGFTWMHLALDLFLMLVALALLKYSDRGMLALDNLLWPEQETSTELDEGGANGEPTTLL